MVRGLRYVGWVVLVATGCKATIGDAPQGRAGDAGPLDGRPVDAGPDAPPDAPLGLFSTPAAIPIAATAAAEDDPVLSSDGLELIYAIDNTAAGTGKDLYRSTRATTADAFGAPVEMTTLDTATNEEGPRLSADDLTLWYASNEDVYSSTRTAAGDDFPAGAPLAYVNTTAYEKWFDACPDGYYLVSRANGATGMDFFEGQVGAPTTGAVAELNSPEAEISTFLTEDCLTVYFASTRAVGSANPVRIYTSTRATEQTPWSTPVAVTEFGVTADDEDLYITDHGHLAVLASTRGPTGTKDVFLSTR